MTTRPLQVLVLESHAGTAEPAARALAAAGHEVVRCHDSASTGFPCVGLTDRETCPLRHGVDVALDVRAAPATEPTALEDGVGCALREGVPVVESPGDASSPLHRWTVPGGVDVVAACEAAAASAFDDLASAVVVRLQPLLVGNGVDRTAVRCEIERSGRSLHVHLIGPPLERGLRQEAAVHAYDAVRAADRAFEEVRITFRPSAGDAAG
jgi:hypothetical protein